CIKAGLSPDSWLLDGTKIYTFQAIIFEEKAPGGEVALKEIGGKTCDS
ncbi:MAG: TIGR00296 family protein, partial [Candidatus Bathyarchaeota archaeon]|nr:TIGR00296 family protein [Candidatus Bathyarchaeota archaeon]